MNTRNGGRRCEIASGLNMLVAAVNAPSSMLVAAVNDAHPPVPQSQNQEQTAQPSVSEASQPISQPSNGTITATPQGGEKESCPLDILHIALKVIMGIAEKEHPNSERERKNMSQSQKFNLLTQEMRKSRNTHEFNSDENPHMTEDTWRSFFVATKAAWKNRIGTGSNSRISKLFKKESQVRTPLRSATGLPAGQPGTFLPKDLFETCQKYFMCDPQVLYAMSGANSTETASPAPQCDDALSDEVINKMKKPELKALCKKHDLARSGNNPELKKRILDHMKATIVARQVPREAPVPQVPPEDSSPAAAPILPPSSGMSPMTGMSPPTSESESDRESVSDRESEKDTGPKTRDSKFGRNQKRKYHKEKNMRKLLAGVETMAENSSPTQLQKAAREMVATSLEQLLPRDGTINQSPNQYIVLYKKTLDQSKLIVKGALKQIPTSADPDSKDHPKFAYRMYVELIDEGIQAVMNPLHKEHQRWQFMAHSIGEHGNNGLDIYNDVRVAFPEAILPCVYSEETEDSW